MVSDLEVGKAAEHLVCYDLIMQGYRAFLSDQGLPYDVLVDIHGRMIRIQVKAIRQEKEISYHSANTWKGYRFSALRKGKNGKKRLSRNDCDVIACVALDKQIIAYVPIEQATQTFELRSSGHKWGRWHKHKTIDQFPFSDVLSD